MYFRFYGLLDGVTFAHKLRLLNVAAQLKCSAPAALGFAIIPVAGQRTHGTTFRMLKVTSQVASPGVESAVCGYLVILGIYCDTAVAHVLVSSC